MNERVQKPDAPEHVGKIAWNSSVSYCRNGSEIETRTVSGTA